jgi:hypothetical protein
VLPVVLLHLGLAWQWLQWRLDAEHAAAFPPRLQVAFVRDLLPAPPPPLPPPHAVARRPVAAVQQTPLPAEGAASAASPASATSATEGAASAASAATAAAPDSEPAPVPSQLAAEQPTTVASPPVSPAASAAEQRQPLAPSEPVFASAPSASAAGATALPTAALTAFAWPPSTRLSYLLTGHYKGPVEGQASVEWRLVGERYQVEVEVGIGPFFAPIVSRVSQSEGLISNEGLAPRRYDEETRVAFRAPQRLGLALAPDSVRLPSGRELPRPPGLQDTASQFVQMTWLFTTQPERLRAGELIRFPLALPRQVLEWTYEVAGAEELHTPLGVLATWHVRPRPPEGARGVLLVEFWVAPALQYLPVRVLIRQDEESFVDLQLRRAPQQAEPGAPAPR